MFLALDLPEGPRAALAAWRDALVAGRPELRPVAVEALHVTLVFLGWQDEADAERIAAAAFGAAGGRGAPSLSPAGVRPLPPLAPRLFALELADEDGRAAALQAALSEALAAERVYTPEKRPFWPHVTLARVKRGRRPGSLPAAAPPGDAFEAAGLTLYRSTLRPPGAVYDALARMRLR